MNSLDLFISKNIKNNIDASGTLINKDVNPLVNSALKAGRRLIGGTLVTNNNKFIISMVELYYGSIADDCQDWYRVNYLDKHYGISKRQVEQQNQKGLRFYSKHQSNSNRNRIDLVIGEENVAVSFLIRNMIRMDGSNIAKSHGGPGLVASELFSYKLLEYPEIYYKKDLTDTKISGFHAFYDTHDIFMKKNNNPQICENLRCNKNRFSGLLGKYSGRLWNLSIFDKSFLVPEEITKLS